MAEKWKGTFVVCKYLILFSESVIGSSGINFVFPERITSRSSALKCSTSSSVATKSESLMPVSSSTVVPKTSAVALFTISNLPVSSFTKIK